MNVDLRHGDCVDLMRAMPECSVDSIVTDPPYGLEFMGKEWDAPWKKAGKVERAAEGTDRSHPFRDGAPRIEYGIGGSASAAFQDWFTVVAAECLRVLKPGGHLLAFGGTRTYHRMACAIEDAGFEIRDSIHWVYGSGFPKSLNVGKAIDKAAGAVREVVGYSRGTTADPSTGRKDMPGKAVGVKQVAVDVPITAPATAEAVRWEGWGTALKPAHEPVVVARKPLSGTVASNVLVWGTGGLNIDGCRVGKEGATTRGDGGGRLSAQGAFTTGHAIEQVNAGRWPANIVLDGAAAAALDQQSGNLRPATSRTKRPDRGPFATGAQALERDDVIQDGGGGASRFFTQADFGPDDWPFVYQAKPSKRERNAGLDGLPDVPGGALEGNADHGNARKIGDKPDVPVAPTKNHHPTVKPVALMRHLVRLVTPPGGVVLDPFAGSGTTLVAAVLEGMNAIGCEMTDEYLPIIRGRVAWAEGQALTAAEAEANPEQPTLL